MGQDVQQLAGFAAVGEQQAYVLRCNDPEITVQGIGGIEEQRHQPDGGEGGGDLASHDAAFANAADHQLGFAIGAAFQQGEGGLHLFAAQSFSCCGDGRCFLLQAAGQCGQRLYP